MWTLQIMSNYFVTQFLIPETLCKHFTTIKIITRPITSVYGLHLTTASTIPLRFLSSISKWFGTCSWTDIQIYVVIIDNLCNFYLFRYHCQLFDIILYLNVVFHCIYRSWAFTHETGGLIPECEIVGLRFWETAPRFTMVV